MKLRFSSTSPYTRKVLVLAHETGLAARIDLINTVVTATKPNAEMARLNPLMKLPTLETDDGLALFDSPVICQYLDSLHTGRKIVPETGPARWRAMRLEALADGIIDAAILGRIEVNARPEPMRWQAWIDGQMCKVLQGVDMAEREVEAVADAFDIGHIALACCIGFLEFRSVVGHLRDRAPRLTKWFDGVSQRPSMLITKPQ